MKFSLVLHPLFSRFTSRLLWLFIVVFFADASFAQQKVSLTEAAIIPKPVRYELQQGKFMLNNAVFLKAAPQVSPSTVALFKQAALLSRILFLAHKKV